MFNGDVITEYNLPLDTNMHQDLSRNKDWKVDIYPKEISSREIFPKWVFTEGPITVISHKITLSHTDDYIKKNVSYLILTAIVLGLISLYFVLRKQNPTFLLILLIGSLSITITSIYQIKQAWSHDLTVIEVLLWIALPTHIVLCVLLMKRKTDDEKLVKVEYNNTTESDYVEKSNITKVTSPSPKTRETNNDARQIYHLKLLHDNLKNFLEIHFTGDTIVYNEKINKIYLELCVKIEKIINEPIFKKIPRKNWRYFDNLLFSDSDNEIDWEYGGREKCYKLQSKIEELFIKNGKKTFDLESEEKEFIESVQSFLKKYESEKLDDALKPIMAVAKIWEFFTSKKSELTEKMYDSGEQYDFYKDIKEILGNASREVFIVESYPDVTLFELYIDSIPSKTLVNILTHDPPSNFIHVGKMLSKKRPIQIKDSKLIHDRFLFVDDKCWMIGTSIKDVGKKPTMIMKITKKDEAYKKWKNLFDEGKNLI